MSNRATGSGGPGPGKPPLYKVVMLGDSGVGKTSLGTCSVFGVGTSDGCCVWYLFLGLHNARPSNAIMNDWSQKM
jgi:hypothetical protein